MNDIDRTIENQKYYLAMEKYNFERAKKLSDQRIRKLRKRAIIGLLLWITFVIALTFILVEIFGKGD